MAELHIVYTLLIIYSFCCTITLWPHRIQTSKNKREGKLLGKHLEKYIQLQGAKNYHQIIRPHKTLTVSGEIATSILSVHANVVRLQSDYMCKI